jgi:hypothetical protein
VLLPSPSDLRMQRHFLDMKPITPELAEILDIIDADRKPDRALRRLKFLGAGGYATVYQHPADPELVVRFSSGFDGWFAYAERLKQEVGSPETGYGPRMHDMAYLQIEGDDYWVGLSERLTKIDVLDIPRAEIIRAVQCYAAPHRYERAEEGDLALLAAQPGLKEFIDRYCGEMEDFHAGNFMLRGDELVVNDPTDDAPAAEVKRLKALYNIEGRPRMEPEMAAAGGMMP